MSENKDNSLNEYNFPIANEQTKKIKDQLKCICKIMINDEIKATGFFCNINYDISKEPSIFLITNNHVLNETDIKSDKIIKIFFYDNERLNNREVKIGRDRIVYTSEKYDITFIEMNKEKEEISNYLELDRKIFQRNSNFFYLENSIYILHFLENEIPSASFGVLKKEENPQNNYELIHN